MKTEDHFLLAPAKREGLAGQLACVLTELHQDETLDRKRLDGVAEHGAAGRWQLTCRARGTVSVRYCAELIDKQKVFPGSSLGFLLKQALVWQRQPSLSRPFKGISIPD
jgi:hypothetical protein